MLTFRGTNKSFQLDGDLFKTMTNYDFNDSLSNPQDQKLIYEFGKEMNFSNRQIGRKRTGDRSLAKLLKSSAIMVSGISTKFPPESPNEFCYRIKLILQEKLLGNNSDVINYKNIAVVDK